MLQGPSEMEVTPDLYDRALWWCVIVEAACPLIRFPTCGTGMPVIFQDTGKHLSQSGIQTECPAQRATAGYIERGTTCIHRAWSKNSPCPPKLGSAYSSGLTPLPRPLERGGVRLRQTGSDLPGAIPHLQHPGGWDIVGTETRR